MDNHDVFISYSRMDIVLAKAIMDELEKNSNAKCWMDIDGIYSGSQFEAKIISAIDSCTYVVFLMSENSMRSEWTEKEIRYATSTGKMVIPVNIDGSKPSGWFLFTFSGTDIIDYRNNIQKTKFLNNMKEWCSEPDTVSEAAINESAHTLTTVQLSELTERANSGDVQAMKELGIYYAQESRIYMEEQKCDLSIQEIAAMENDMKKVTEAKQRTHECAKQAYSWLMKAGDRGDGEAYYILADMFIIKAMKEEYVESKKKSTAAIIFNSIFSSNKDVSLQNDLIKKSALMGYAPAQFSQAMKTLNKGKALIFMESSASQGFAPAQYTLASWYETNDYHVSDQHEKERIGKAISWYSLAAEQGYKDAAAKVAILKNAAK